MDGHALSKMAEHPDSSIRIAAAKHPNITQLTLIKLCYDKNWWVRHFAMEHKKLSSKIALNKICDYYLDDPRVILNLVTNKNLPARSLEKISNKYLYSHAYQLMIHVAAHRNLPMHLLELYFFERNSELSRYLWKGIAMNENSPYYMIFAMIQANYCLDLIAIRSDLTSELADALIEKAEKYNLDILLKLSENDKLPDKTRYKVNSRIKMINLLK